MSEYCVMVGSEGQGGVKRDLTMTTALEVARIIHLDLTRAGVSAWQWWLAFSSSDYKDGLIFSDWQKPGDPETIYPARLLWALGNYSRFVRPGMRRVEVVNARDDIHSFLASAYKGEKERRVAAVYINMSNQPQPLRIRFSLGHRKWVLKSLTPYITSDRPGDELKRYPDVEPDRAMTLVPRSVTTLLAQFN